MFLNGSEGKKYIILAVIRKESQVVENTTMNIRVLQGLGETLN
jgi:hypothetical protein